MADLKLCSLEGCGKQHQAKGFCGSHYQRHKRHGDPNGGGTQSGEPLLFLEKSIATVQDDCIEWPYARDRNGYAKIYREGKFKIVPRIVCERLQGPPPTEKHQASHLCGRGHLGCINGKHLRWKTAKENHADKLLHGTDNRGEKSALSKLTRQQVERIRDLKGSRTQLSLAEEYGVAPSTISMLQSGRYWAWL